MGRWVGVWMVGKKLPSGCALKPAEPKQAHLTTQGGRVTVRLSGEFGAPPTNPWRKYIDLAFERAGFAQLPECHEQIAIPLINKETAALGKKFEIKLR